MGIVLSLSVSEGIPESFHLAPAEGACAGCAGLLLDWPGVEYIYPADVICAGLQEIKERILKMADDPAIYEAERKLLREYVEEHYGIERFLERLNRYLLQARIMG